MSVNQNTIARELGLSRRAVGFALSDDPLARKQISVETRKRILQTARRLNYRPNRSAQRIRRQKSGLIGIIKTIATIQVCVERSYFASQAIQAAGYGLLVSELLWDPTGIRRAVDAMLGEQVEGVLLADLASADETSLTEFERLREANVPIVTLGGGRLPGVPCVTPDYRQGMRLMTAHVLAQGYRRLALALPIAADNANALRDGVFAEWLAGYREATSGLPRQQAVVLFHPSLVGWTDGYASGYAAVQQARAMDVPPQVLLCGGDVMAIGAIAACSELGWRVPQDMAITGFDNATAGRYAIPPLTTVAQPTNAVAGKAVDVLLQLVSGGAARAQRKSIMLPCEVVVRQSAGRV